MIVNKNLLDILKERVALRFGTVPKTPTDFNLLAVDIFDSTGRSLGISTIKRIWGYVEANHGTSFSSLSILCRYVGFNDWDNFTHYVNNHVAANEPETSGFGNDTVLVTSFLPLGTKIQMDWYDEKSCRIRKIKEPDLFELEATRNIKLKSGDIGRIENIVLGKPFTFIGTRRGSHQMGTYFGAQKGGIKKITIISD